MLSVHIVLDGGLLDIPPTFQNTIKEEGDCQCYILQLLTGYDPRVLDIILWGKEREGRGEGMIIISTILPVGGLHINA